MVLWSPSLRVEHGQAGPIQAILRGQETNFVETLLSQVSSLIEEQTQCQRHPVATHEGVVAGESIGTQDLECIGPGANQNTLSPLPRRGRLWEEDGHIDNPRAIASIVLEQNLCKLELSATVFSSLAHHRHAPFALQNANLPYRDSQVRSELSGDCEAWGHIAEDARVRISPSLPEWEGVTKDCMQLFPSCACLYSPRFSDIADQAHLSLFRPNAYNTCFFQAPEKAVSRCQPACAQSSSDLT